MLIKNISQIVRILFGRRYGLILLTTAISFSCKKFVTIPPADNLIVSEIIFSDSTTATGAVRGIYSEMMAANGSQFTASGTTIYAGMCADELTHFSPGSKNEYIKNELSEASHTSMQSIFWDKAYKYIFTANLCLEGLEKSTKLSSNLKANLMGECYFIRAFCYFHLVNFFGGVPLATTADFNVTATLPRAPVNDIYNQMTNDLLKAKAKLPTTYDIINNQEKRIRPNKWAATALLARVYLYKKEWANAEIQASEVISSPVYQLQTNLANVFQANTPQEAIWQLLQIVPSPPAQANNTWEGFFVLPPGSSSSAPNTYLLTDTLMKAFETGDLRKTNWIGSRDYQTKTYYYPAKYKVRGVSSTVTEHYMVLRLAEQYLIRAEARAEQNKLDDAADDIDIIRNRAGLNPTTATSQEDLRLAIEQERRVELFAEWGHRWFDIKRTNRADALLGTYKSTTWQSTDALWPIPSGQIKLNGALIQNPGY